MEAVLLVGLQGSGKASFYLARFFQTHIRLSLDMVRTRHRQNLLVRACIEAKQPFVLDNTNVTRTERAPYLALARAGRFRVVGFYVDTPVGECLRRNELRDGRARVPVTGIVGTARRIEAPRPDEGFDALYRVHPDGRGGFTVEDWGEDVGRP